MITKAHHQLAKRFNKYPLRVVINDLLLEILELLFTEEEASIASRFPMKQETSAKIAKLVKRPEAEMRPILDRMAEKGLIHYYGDGPARKYMILAFVPGLFESFMWTNPSSEKTKRFAKLFDEYFLTSGYMPNLIRRDNTTFRIIPVERAVKNNIGAVPGDLVRGIIDQHEVFSLSHMCACRNQKELIGEGCGKPKDVCMHLGPMAMLDIKNGYGRKVSKEEILEAADRAEEAGLIHFADNVERPLIICNCCVCCCGGFTTLSRYNMPATFVNSRYIVKHDVKKCKTCGDCAKACPMGALHVFGKKLIFESTRCIGCGNCVPKCKSNAIEMALRNDCRPIPQNYGQLIADLTTQYFGIQRLSDQYFPGLTRSFGNMINRKIKKRYKYAP
ncbi:MAG: 4Fe-4S binding protein [Proteobacteria bacterium]|nr:4Fe-4S binding protein [Pseudomonadota bacterium]